MEVVAGGLDSGVRTTIPGLAPFLDGLTWGIMLVMIAIGLTLIFGFLGVLNFAHGSFYMLGGYLLLAVFDATGNFWAGLLAAVIGVCLVGAVVERVTLRPLYDADPITHVVVTFGVALLIQASAIMLWGARATNVPVPAVLGGSVSVLGTQYPVYRIFISIIGVVFIAGVGAVLRYTTLGMVIRASLTDKDMARALGFNIPRIYTVVFSAGVAIAGFAGALMTPLRGIAPTTANTIILQAFIVVVIGGLGSYRGSILAGLGIGMADILIARYISLRLSGVTIFALLVVVLVLRPRGLLGDKSVVDV
jgi:branched-subunit amino acid ABC-type transport system permease component